MISLHHKYELITCTSTVTHIFIHDWTLRTYLLTGGRLKYGQQLTVTHAGPEVLFMCQQSS